MTSITAMDQHFYETLLFERWPAASIGMSLVGVAVLLSAAVFLRLATIWQDSLHWRWDTLHRMHLRMGRESENLVGDIELGSIS